MVGIQQQSLSLEAQDSLKLLVQLACVLQVTQTTPQALLAAWAMLLVRQGKATRLQVSYTLSSKALMWGQQALQYASPVGIKLCSMFSCCARDIDTAGCSCATNGSVPFAVSHRRPVQYSTQFRDSQCVLCAQAHHCVSLCCLRLLLQRKIQLEREALAQKHRTAQQKHAILQKVHADVQATQQKDAKNIEQVGKWTKQAQVKISEYKRGIERFQHKLEKNGFTQEVSLSDPASCRQPRRISL